MENDSQFLNWIYQRLVCVHGENPNRDYMHRLMAIIEKLDQDKLKERTK